MGKYGMAIDLKRCVGCGACAIACKTENNTEIERNGKRFNWADFFVKTDGKFSQGDLKHYVFPTLCNHCTDAPCITVCPAMPKALYKTNDGITMLNHDNCIGCGYCINRCPYSDHNVDVSGVQYSVISRNDSHIPTHSFYTDDSQIIRDCTFSPAELNQQIGIRPPDANVYDHPDTKAIRPKNTSEKCTFCAHRITQDLTPYCVTACPAHARVFGDMDDPQSEINQWKAKGYVRLKNNRGDLIEMGESTDIQPNVYYIGMDITTGIHARKPEDRFLDLKVYPNPASSYMDIELHTDKDCVAIFSVFDLMGREMHNLRLNNRLYIGSNTIRLDISMLKSGTYLLRLIADTKTYSSKFVVLR